MLLSRILKIMIEQGEASNVLTELAQAFDFNTIENNADCLNPDYVKSCNNICLQYFAK